MGNFVCHTGFYPLHPDTLQSGLDVVASADSCGGMLCRRKILLSGSRRVAIVHDDKNRICPVEHSTRDTARQAVMPETTITHNGECASFHGGVDRSGTCQTQPIAEYRIAKVERR